MDTHALLHSKPARSKVRKQWVKDLVPNPTLPLTHLEFDIKYMHVHGSKRNAMMLTVIDVKSRYNDLDVLQTPLNVCGSLSVSRSYNCFLSISAGAGTSVNPICASPDAYTTIETGTSVEFKAGTYVRLTAPFSALNGAYFRAKIVVPCTEFFPKSTPISVESSTVRSYNATIAMASPTMLSYPNPVIDNFHISYSISQPGYVKLSIVSQYGQEVLQPIVDGHLVINEYNATVNLRSLPPGVYYCVLNSEFGVVANKFIVL